MALGLVAAITVGCRGLGLEHPDRIGAQLTADGSLVIVYRTCRADTTVTHVEVDDTNGSRATTADDQRVWAISSDSPNSSRRFVSGQLPVGFVEDQPFAGLSSAAELLLVTVRSSALPQGESAYFKASDLRHDRLRVGDEYETEAKFTEGNACG
jgi:hypothetical protein